MTFLFQHFTPVVVGRYLLGTPRWAKPMQLKSARLSGVSGGGVVTVLELEVGGVLTGKQLPIKPLAAGQRVDITIPLEHFVAAGADVRFKCVSAPADPQQAVSELGVTITYEDGSTLPVPTPAFFVNWVHGAEMLTLFLYNPVTHQFTEAQPGISAGRAAIVNSVNFSVTIQNGMVWKIGADRVLSINWLSVTGGTGTSESPRLEFYIGSQRVATITQAGTLYVLDVSELPSVQGGLDRFELYGGGVLSAVLGPTRLEAVQIAEPLN